MWKAGQGRPCVWHATKDRVATSTTINLIPTQLSDDVIVTFSTQNGIRKNCSKCVVVAVTQINGQGCFACTLFVVSKIDTKSLGGIIGKHFYRIVDIVWTKLMTNHKFGRRQRAVVDSKLVIRRICCVVATSRRTTKPILARYQVRQAFRSFKRTNFNPILEQCQ